ncbi:VanW family protein [Paenibacillus physcomitrellae]|uniref:G5 domain-containing protein n=1 Tax=Paenibacillus physcomitrellae TaxID=1619311 RepID=A0ABQ1GGN0_9BACL|nr:VanW family protein [Paenibacillus physcomitrellae]GGA43446.1 hypothetical protein GCM10010917_30920 [Paenibacillus physcomitrellae]
MRNKKLLIYTSSSLLLLAAALWGALILYGGQTTVPRGVVIGGLPIGGMETRQVSDLLAKESEALLQQPIVLVSQKPALSIKATWGRSGITIQSKELLQALARLQEGNWWEKAKYRYDFKKNWSTEVLFNDSVLKKTLNEDWEIRQFGAMKNAERVIRPGDQIGYIPEVQALRIQWDELGKTLLSQTPRVFRANPGNHPVKVELPLEMASPPVTVTSLKAQGVDRRVSLFTTRLTGSSGRLHNVDAAAKVIDGMLLAPGEVFDYAEVIRKAESQYGFCEAPVIIQGRLAPGVGGGICQVSGTLYGAAIRAGLEIVERRNHSKPVGYLPIGQDATFSTGYINFKFKNNTSGYLLISAKSGNGAMTVKLFGNLPSNVYYTIRSQTVKVLSPSVRYISNPALPAGLRQTLKQGTPGYIVETYRIKWTDGQPGKEELLSRDTYPSQPSLVAVHTAATDPGAGTGQTQPPSGPKIIEDGVHP